jgi:hypothetical protein
MKSMTDLLDAPVEAKVGSISFQLLPVEINDPVQPALVLGVAADPSVVKRTRVADHQFAGDALAAEHCPS